MEQPDRNDWPSAEPWRDPDEPDKVLSFVGDYARRLQWSFCILFGVGLPSLVIMNVVGGMPFSPGALITLGVVEIAGGGAILHFVKNPLPGIELAGGFGLIAGAGLVLFGLFRLILQ